MSVKQRKQILAHHINDCDLMKIVKWILLYLRMNQDFDTRKREKNKKQGLRANANKLNKK